MEKLTDTDKAKYYTQVLERIGNYTDLHMEIIKILVPEIKKYLKITEGVKMCYKNYIFPLESLIKGTEYDSLIILEILNDFVKDGLLLIITQLPEQIFSVTDRGIICFEHLLKNSEVCKSAS